MAGFSGCVIDKAGTGYTLTATDGALSSATSVAFDVLIGYKETSGTSAITGTTVASGSLTLTANHTYVVFAFSDSGSTGDTVSVTPSTFTTNPSVNTSGTASYASKDIEWAGYLSGGSGTGTLTAIFHNTIKQAYLEVIDVTGANTSLPIAECALGAISGTTPTNPAATNLTNTPNASNGELVYWNSEQSTTTPSSSSSSLSLVTGTSNQATSGSQSIFGGTPPQQTESLTMNTSHAWGTIAIELNHG